MHTLEQNVWGEENVPENALSRKILDPSKKSFSCLLFRGFLYRKNRALTPQGSGKRTVREGVQNPFLGGVSFVRFSTPLFFPPPPWRPLKLALRVAWARCLLWDTGSGFSLLAVLGCACAPRTSPCPPKKGSPCEPTEACQWILLDFCLEVLRYEVGVLLTLQKLRKNKSDSKVIQTWLKNGSKIGSGVHFWVPFGVTLILSVLL